MPDTSATLEILVEQLQRYEETTFEDSHGGVVGPVPQEMEELHEFCQRSKNADLAGRLVYNDDGEVVFNFGKHRGRSVKDLLDKEPGYYGWMINGDFPRYTLRVLKQIKDGTFGK